MAKKNQKTDAPVQAEENQKTDAPVQTEDVPESPKPKRAKIIESVSLEHDKLRAFAEAVKNTGQKDIAVIGFDNLSSHLEGLGYNVVSAKEANVICSNDPNVAHQVQGYGWFLTDHAMQAPDGFSYVSHVLNFVHVIRKVV